jgi:propionate CoA-transferase
LGFLQVDSDGNVNVSSRGERIRDYVGPGGFPDIVHGAEHIIFIGNWMHPCGFELRGEKVSMQKVGTPKFVERVREVTFNGQMALARGKQVYYVTDVGYFKLTDNGLQLMARYPGIRIKEDILAHSGAQIYIPPGEAVPVIDPAIVNGFGFEPSLLPFRLDVVLS